VLTWTWTDPADPPAPPEGGQPGPAAGLVDDHRTRDGEHGHAGRGHAHHGPAPARERDDGAPTGRRVLVLWVTVEDDDVVSRIDGDGGVGFTEAQLVEELVVAGPPDRGLPE